MNWGLLPGPQFCVWFVFKQFSFGGQIHKCELAYFWRFDFFPATLFSKSSLAYRYKKHTNLGKNDVFGCENVPIVVKSKQTYWRRDSVSTYHISLIERWLWSFCLAILISCWNTNGKLIVLQTNIYGQKFKNVNVRKILTLTKRGCKKVRFDFIEFLRNFYELATKSGKNLVTERLTRSKEIPNKPKD